MSGKPGRSGRPKGSVSEGVAERNARILAFYLAGHSVRQTAFEYNLHPSLIGRIVKGQRPRRPAPATGLERGVAPNR